MSNKPRVVITDFIADDLAIERRLLGDGVEIVALNAFREEEMAGRIDEAAAVMVYHNIRLSRMTIERLTQCKLIVRCGVGVDNIDLTCATQRGIPVANVPDYGTEDVADTAIGMALSLVRGTHLMNSTLRGVPSRQGGTAHGAPSRQGGASVGGASVLGEPAGASRTQPQPPDANEWSYTLAAPVHRIRGRVFAVIGLGRIGTAAALRAKALGFDVAFFDPYKADGCDKSLGIRRVEKLDDLLRQAFVLSLHTPLTPETKHMIDAAAIASLPRGSFMVNTSRGAVVDTSAIPDAIASGQLAGAGIDVLQHEPPGESDVLVKAWRDPSHPAHHRVIINPHSAFYSEEGLLDMRVKGSEACRRALSGERIRNVVNGV
ncbi:MAG: C-terminal binding protein [Phycisphaeraceae bacterium]